MATTEPAALTGTYVLDTARTRLGFVARLGRLAKVRGEFESFEGHAHLDFASPERSSVEVTVDVASVNTRNTRRDKHLRSGDFLDASNHPRMIFRSTAIRQLDDDRFTVKGDLSVRGTACPVTVDFGYTGVIEDSGGQARVGFEGEAVVDRRDWGITWGGALISPKVRIQLQASAVNTARRATV